MAFSDTSCPHCQFDAASGSSAGQSSSAGQTSCPECGFPVRPCRRLLDPLGLSIDSIGAFADTGQASADSTRRPPIEYQNAAAIVRLGEHEGVVVGRSSEPIPNFEVHAVRHRSLAERQLALLKGESGALWIVDLGGEAADVFVDGRMVKTAELSDGAVVQVGPLAWQFNGAKRLLAPVTPIAGCDLIVDAEVQGRLTRSQLQIRRGEMTALVGPSGCGKSTLLETIRDGSGLAEGSEPQSRVFFVPQQDLVHRDLRLGDALRAIGRIYGRDVLPFEIDAALDAVGLPTTFKRKFPSELSGGQLRRFRIAGALLSGAGVIVLDEPDSGLDHETADEIIGLLHSLSVRGATVVAVTHHRPRAGVL